MADNKYERIFCAEQINVPPDLPAILKQLTKAVIKADPAGGMDTSGEGLVDYKLFEFCFKFFSGKVEERATDSVHDKEKV